MQKNTVQQIMERKQTCLETYAGLRTIGGEGGDVCNDGERNEERKTMQRTVGRHQEWCADENRKAQDRGTWRTVVKTALDNQSINQSISESVNQSIRTTHGAMDRWMEI